MAKRMTGTTKRDSAAGAPSEPVMEPVPPTQPVDNEELAEVLRKGELIRAVRDHSAKKIEDDEKTSWNLLKELTDEEIWVVIEWCDTPRGAISMMARALNKRGGQ
jgi:hypothetical protein